jgi:hypothetical protein
MTQKYKCIAQPNGIRDNFTIGKEYEVRIVQNLYGFQGYPNRVLSNLDYEVAYSNYEFNRCFQKVEPTQPTMKYKVTISSTDLTGHEDEKEVYENQTEFDVCCLIAEMAGSRFLIEPQTEKQKVTVWFYVVSVENKPIYSVSYLLKENLIPSRKKEIELGRVVSEIKSMEVEL